MGPRILGFRRKLVDGKYSFERIVEGDRDDVNDGGIDFSLRALPLGGYVRFPENYNRTLAFENDDTARKFRDEARLMRVETSSPLEKGLEKIAAQSFVLNTLTLGLLKRWQATRERAQLENAEREVEIAKTSRKNSWLSSLPWSVEPDSEAETKLSKLRAAKTPDVDYFDDPNLLQNRKWQERAVVLSGGIVFNILLAFSCYFAELNGRGLPTPVYKQGAVVTQTPQSDSPSFGLLGPGDIIVGVNDNILFDPDAATGFQGQKDISTIISTIRSTEGQDVKLTILHGKNSEQEVRIAPRVNDDGVKSIGVMLGPNFSEVKLVKASNFVDGAIKAGNAVYELTTETAKSIYSVLIGLLIGKGTPAGISMSGPVGVIKSGADVVKSSDLSAVVAFAASISINLAVVNSLPLPALDGGQLLFVLAEAASGRKIDQRLQESVNAGTLLILFLISIGTTVGDVTALFR